MSDLINDRYLRAALCQPVDYTPVWMMRQAGRYLPEYRALRAQAGSFMALCKDPELACEVTLQPLRRFDLDAAIIFSDILTIPDAMGLGLHFDTGEGPKFDRPLSRSQDIIDLPIPDPERELKYVMDAIRTTRKNLAGQVPLIGFSGSPWTLATYMIEGGSSKGFTKIKKMLYSDPQLLHQLLDKLADSVVLYLNAQIAAGAQAVMLFDTWGGVLSHDCYPHFSLHYMQKIIAGLQRGVKPRCGVDGYVPVTLFTKGGGVWLKPIAESGCDVIGIDWTLDLHQARQSLNSAAIALQGNLDPSVLYAPANSIEQQVERVLAEFGPHNGHIFNFGHGIQQDIATEQVKTFIDLVHQRSRGYHLC